MGTTYYFYSVKPNYSVICFLRICTFNFPRRIHRLHYFLLQFQSHFLLLILKLTPHLPPLPNFPKRVTSSLVK